MSEPAPGKRSSLVILRTLVGGVAVGLAVNAISDAYKGAGPAAAVLFVLFVAVELRALPPQAPIHRLVARMCLVTAALAAVISLLVPPSARGWAVLVSATLGIAGCLTPVPSRDTPNQLFDVALIGGGVAVWRRSEAASPICSGPGYLSAWR